MDLAAYMARIGYDGPQRPDLETLSGLVRAHIEAVPFENLDVQLGRPVDLTVEHAFAKIVDRRRGGWCYEQNGLFGWVLGELGFTVRRVSGAVLRDKQGDGQLGTHLVLIVALDEEYLVDVGFGSSLTGPLALRDGTRRTDAPFTVALDRIEGGFWRFSETLDAEPFTFDFRPEAADESQLQAQSDRQQRDPDSPFVRRLVAQIRDGGAHVTLRGTMLTRTTTDGTQTTELPDAGAFVATLRNVFGLDIPEIADLWPRHAPV